MNMFHTIRETVRERALFEGHASVLLAVSGGADSVAMAHALHRMREEVGFHMAVAHLNHNLRGEEAVADARFVEQLAQALDVPFYLGESDVRAASRDSKVSIEMAAREARYRFLCETARSMGATAIATAHTADDQAETLLFRIMRGTGPRGLVGIPYVAERDGIALVRPLRDVRRRDVTAYLEEVSQAWREDASNLDTRFMRNRVRHKVIPFLEKELNPQLIDAVLRLGDLAAVEAAWIDDAIRDPYAACIKGTDEAPILSVPMLTEQPRALRRLILLRWLQARGVDSAHIGFQFVRRVEALTTSLAGTQAASVEGDLQVQRMYDVLDIVRADAGQVEPFCKQLVIPGETPCERMGCRVVASWRAGVIRPVDQQVARLPAEASLSRKAIGSSPVQIRSWDAGDTMRPWGMDGSRKLQDIFVDEKVPRPMRCRVPVIVCREEVIWLPGYRVAKDWAVEHETDEALHLHIEQL